MSQMLCGRVVRVLLVECGRTATSIKAKLRLIVLLQNVLTPKEGRGCTSAISLMVQQCLIRLENLLRLGRISRLAWQYLLTHDDVSHVLVFVQANHGLMNNKGVMLFDCH